MPAALAVIVAAMLFGTTGTAQALGPTGTDPLSVGVMRLVVGGTVLALVGFSLGRRRRVRTAHLPRPTAASLGLMAVTGICLAAYQPLFFLGTARSGVAVGTVVALGSAPVIAGLLEWGLRRRPPAPRWAIATGFATAGVLLLGLGGGTTGTVDLAGIAASIGAGASFAIFTNAQRQLMDAGWDPFTVAGAMGAGAAVIAVGAVPFVDLAWLADPAGLAMSLWLGIATIALAYTLFTWGLERLSAATAATLTLAEPVTAGLLGFLVLGERLGALGVIGVLALAGALLLLALARTPSRVRAR